MSAITVNGGQRLSGVIPLQGAKNSALPILAGTVLCRGECEIHNCPELSDVRAAIAILKHLGVRVQRQGTVLSINARVVSKANIPDELMREMRSSIVFLGAIAARTGQATLSSPGGCELGPRPIDLHLAALRELGLTIEEEQGRLQCRCEKGLTGAEITLSFPSVGATENVILAAATAKGKTLLHNPAREPEITDLCSFLNACGAEIAGAGTDLIEINGVPTLHGAVHRVIPDRIVAATYLAAAAVTGSRLLLKNVVPQHLLPVLSVLKNAGCAVQSRPGEVLLSAPERLGRVPVLRTMPYPGFPTDAGPPIIAMLSTAQGCSMFIENIFENRYKFTDELNRFGADVRTNARVAVINGVQRLYPAKVECTDLRGGAAMLVAALAAKGCSTVEKAEHIYRGYEQVCETLQSVGAQISAN